MGWFSRKPSHEKQVAAVQRMTVNMFENIAAPGRIEASGLQFRLPDSQFRFLMFCAASVHTVCAKRMSNADAVLNEFVPNLIRGVLSSEEQRTFFGGVPKPQAAATLGMNCLGDFLDRWSAYIDIARGGNSQAATALVASMLLATETLGDADEVDGSRLSKLARFVEVLMEPGGPIDKGFVELTD